MMHKTIWLIRSLEARLHFRSASVDILVIRDIEFMIEEFSQSVRSPQGIQHPFSFEIMNGWVLHSIPHQFTQLLCKLYLRSRGLNPPVIEVRPEIMHDALSVAEDILSNLTQSRSEK